MVTQDHNDIMTMARTLLGESEAWDIEDAQAIACVILNRVKYPNWPDTVAEVCLQPWQFSCWNANDPNRKRIVAAKPTKGSWFEKCVDIAQAACTGKLHDITNGSTHYYATWMKTPPKWARGKQPQFMSDKGTYSHVFFNDIDTKPAKTPKEALDQHRPLSESRTMRGGAVAVGGLTVATVAEAAQAVSPLGGIVSDVVRYAPWVLVVLALIAVGWMMYARWDDRRKGKV